jgi:hypothetical protein
LYPPAATDTNAMAQQESTEPSTPVTPSANATGSEVAVSDGL